MTLELEDADTRIGRIEFENGYPTKLSVQALFDEMDFQRATQAYLWSLPIMGFAQWHKQHEAVFGAKDTDLVLYDSYRDKLGLLTANATTPYILGFPNLARTGPLVLEVPPGPTAGGISSLWQMALNGEFGEAGPDRGRGDKLLVIGPEQRVEDTEGYRVVQAPTFVVFIGLRILTPDPDEAAALREGFRLYPYAERGNPEPTNIVSPDGKAWSGTQPRGMAYWQLLSETLQREPVREQDRVMMAMLKPLGIEKGRPFAPDARRTALLTEAAFVGEAMARANAYQKRFDNAQIWPERQWELSLAFEPGEQPPFRTYLDEYASWFYEAVTASRAMATKSPGVGQTYLEATRDAGGNWLDGGKTYRLRVGPNVPAKQFWSVTAYDNQTRVFIDNPHEIADRSSRMDLRLNEDGSADIYFGPEAPEGWEQNWIPTLPGRGWFAYFRLYAPLEPWFDRSWALADIEPVAE